MSSSQSKKNVVSKSPLPEPQKNGFTFPKTLLQKVPFTRPTFIMLTLAVVLIAAVGSAAYFYTQYQKAKEVLGKTTVAAEIEHNDVVERVGKLMELPMNEQPTVATVTDVNKLKAQQFFVKARNGDRVLIYAASKKAILYRISTNKIVEVAPIDVGGNSSTGSPAAY